MSERNRKQKPNLLVTFHVAVIKTRTRSKLRKEGKVCFGSQFGVSAIVLGKEIRATSGFMVAGAHSLKDAGVP